MIHAYHRRRAVSSVPAGTTVLEAAQDRGYQYSHAVLPKGYQSNRRLPPVRGGYGRARSAGRLRAARVARGWWSRPTPPPCAKLARSIWSCCFPTTTRSASPACATSNCELQKLCTGYWAWRMETASRAAMNKYDMDDQSISIVRNNNKCVLCRRCVAACNKVQTVGVIGPVKPRLQHGH